MIFLRYNNTSTEVEMIHQKKQSGFTLIELLIVMAIIGMLAALVGPQIIKRFGGAQQDAARAQIGMFGQALDAHRLDTGKYPTTLEGLISNGGNSPTWKGPYLRGAMPNDPWGKPYQYKRPGRSGRDYDIYSFGADGVDGGEGDNADITYN